MAFNVFQEKLKTGIVDNENISPTSLFNGLKKEESFSFLRAVQEEVLELWHVRRNEGKVLIKMNTGSGKTLVGLLLLYSKLKETKEPVVFLCPDKQLVNQTIIQAKKIGIPVCSFPEDNNFIPASFLNGEQILICTFEKVYNGRSVFKKEEVSINTIVIDDAHLCQEKARKQSSIMLTHSHELAKKIMALFNDCLTRLDSYLLSRIISGDPDATVMQVPYYELVDKRNDLLILINQFESSPEVNYKWQLIGDELMQCDLFIDSTGVEITPMVLPMDKLSSIHDSKHLCIMSATIENQVGLIKDFGFDAATVKKPIIPKNRKDSGERLILAPKKYDIRINRERIIDLIIEYSTRINVVVLSPSNSKAEEWLLKGASLIQGKNINEQLESLKTSESGLYVIVNRYEGVDLPGHSCRMLIVDGFPSFKSLRNKYEDTRIDNVSNRLKAQMIEQGLGRATRSGGDYSVILITNDKLLRFLSLTKNLNRFSPLARCQITAGLDLLDCPPEEVNESISNIKATIDFCLGQDESWKSYHKTIVDGSDDDTISEENHRSLEIASFEYEAINLFRKGAYKEASTIIKNSIIQNKDLKLSIKETAWYTQLVAKLIFPSDKIEADRYQKIAFTTAIQMLRPQFGVEKINFGKHESQAKSVLNEFKEYTRGIDYLQETSMVLSDLRYSPDLSYRKFEAALKELGKFLGFVSSRPENELGSGPDVLWLLNNGIYIVLEAKSEVIHKKITKENIEQLLQSEIWLKKNCYNSEDYYLITLQPPGIKEQNALINEKFRCIDLEVLEKLKSECESFFKAVSTLSSSDIEKVSALLVTHRLISNSFIKTYLKHIK